MFKFFLEQSMRYGVGRAVILGLDLGTYNILDHLLIQLKLGLLSPFQVCSLLMLLAQYNNMQFTKASRQPLNNCLDEGFCSPAPLYLRGIYANAQDFNSSGFRAERTNFPLCSSTLISCTAVKHDVTTATQATRIISGARKACGQNNIASVLVRCGTPWPIQRTARDYFLIVVKPHVHVCSHGDSFFCDLLKNLGLSFRLDINCIL